MTGVNRILDKVPLSFSPAIDSGQILTAVEKRKVMVMKGKIKDTICKSMLSFLAKFGFTYSPLIWLML